MDNDEDDSKKKDGKKKKTTEFPSTPSKNAATTPSDGSGTTPSLTITTRSPASSTCSASTLGTANVVQTTVPRRETSSSQRQLQRRHLFHFILLAGGISAASFALLLVVLLPTAALLALAILVSSVCSLMYLLYQSILLEWNDIIVEGRGVGRDYLPASVYTSLVDTSLHEWMTDPTFMLEHRFLLLYFVPGLTREQLDAYVERLPPRHYHLVHRRGLGQFFFGNNNDFVMRVLLGDAQWRERRRMQQQEQQQHPTELVVERQLLPQVVEEEEEENEQKGSSNKYNNDDDDDSEGSDLGLDITANDLVGNVHDGRALALARWVGLAGNNPPSRDGRQEDAAVQAETPRATIMTQSLLSVATPQPQQQQQQEGNNNVLLQEEYDEEGRIMTEACTSVAYSYSFLAIQSVTSVVSSMVDAVSPYVIQSGLGLATLSAGVGVFGVWMGVYHHHPTSGGRNFPSPRFPQYRTLMTTAIFGGASAGVMVLIRSGLRYALNSTTTTRRVEGKEEKKGAEKKPKEK